MTFERYTIILACIVHACEECIRSSIPVYKRSAQIRQWSLEYGRNFQVTAEEIDAVLYCSVMTASTRL